MNPIARQWINHKINHINAEELIKLGKVYNIQLTKEQAKKIVGIINREAFDIGNKQQSDKVLKQIGNEINRKIEAKIRYLLEVLI